jgi:hypothetical protein
VKIRCTETVFEPPASRKAERLPFWGATQSFSVAHMMSRIVAQARATVRGKNRDAFAAAVANPLFVLASRRRANKTIPTQRIVRQRVSLVGQHALFEHEQSGL